MRAILIDPAKQTITEVDYDGNWTSISTHIDCTTFASAVVFENEDTLYIDDEGLWGATHFFRIEGYPDPLAGRGLILGTNEDGESIAAKSDIEALGIHFVIPIQFPDSGHMTWMRVA